MTKLIGDIENRTWELHMQGFAPSQIAQMLGTTEREAHDFIVLRWRDDKERSRK